ncbi:MAG: LLM class F420-dependent oxidoreductase, partial [Rhodospirillales bacterium]|nr:LLM class F420-dependent oxidoreductase [Rhodospirillales bacterium]
MKAGVSIFMTDYSIQPVALATALEERGFESVWVPEHSHIPLSRASPWPGGADLPKHYYDTYDPFVSLAAMAAVTKKLMLGTGICLVVQRDPIHLAKETASLDQLSGGRFLFGIGGGWNAEEMADHGTDFKTRFKLMDERVDAIKTIWGNSKPEYHGTFVDFPPMMTWPKPVQKPHPQIHVGGGFPHGARRAIAYGDGWMPIGGRMDVLDVLPRFRQMAAEADRDPDSIELSIFGPRTKPDDLKAYADANVSRLIFDLPSEPADKILPRLDR